MDENSDSNILQPIHHARRLTPPLQACGRCQKEVPKTFPNPQDKSQRVCHRCWDILRGNYGPCAECGREQQLVAAHPSKEGKLCNRCFRETDLPLGTCGKCGQTKRLRNPHPTDPEIGRLCTQCGREALGRAGPCGECGDYSDKLRAHPKPKVEKRVCPKCFDRLITPPACSRCLQSYAKLHPNPIDPSRGLLCHRCYEFVSQAPATCAECGKIQTLVDAHPNKPGRVCPACQETLYVGPCGVCARSVPLVKQHPTDAEIGRICKPCFRELTAAVGKCERCGQMRKLRWASGSRRSSEGVCRECLGHATHRIGTCVQCRNEKRLAEPHPLKPELGDVCRACANELLVPIPRLPSEGLCARCKTLKQLPRKHPLRESEGRVCADCYRELLVEVAPCSECGEARYLPRRHPRSGTKGRVCAECFKSLVVGICPDCRLLLPLTKKHPRQRDVYLCRRCARRSVSAADSAQGTSERLVDSEEMRTQEDEK